MTWVTHVPHAVASPGTTLPLRAARGADVAGSPSSPCDNQIGRDRSMEVPGFAGIFFIHLILKRKLLGAYRSMHLQTGGSFFFAPICESTGCFLISVSTDVPDDSFGTDRY